MKQTTRQFLFGTAVLAKPVLTALILFFSCCAFAQSGPLNGSGKIVTKVFDYKNFDKLQLNDLDGNINIEIGKPFAIKLDIDDNLEPLLKVAEYDGELKIKLDGNLNNNLYVENTNIKITIAMPEASVIEHRGNSKLTISGIVGRYLRIKNSGNGNAVLSGSVDELDIICRSNGAVNAEAVAAKKVNIKKSGNGNVYIKTNNSFNATGSGNGDVVNKGNGEPTSTSVVTGNGEIKINNSKRVNPESAPRVAVTITNKTTLVKVLTVKYPGKGSYGIDVKPSETVNETFPVGTKLFKGKQITTFKKPLYVVTDVLEQNFVIE
jgi:hypothetical protein